MSPRINVEDKFFIEIMPVAVAIGDQDRAIGNALRFFRYAQEKHLDGSAITLEEFHAQGFLPQLIPIFARESGDCVEAVGSWKHFGWLKARKKAARKGGRASAKRPRDEKGRLLPSTKNSENHPSKLQAKPSKSNPLPLPLPLTLKETTTTGAPGNLPEEIRNAYRVWTETLASFSVPESPMAPVQESSIARAIRQLGFENVCLALEGQRYERPNEKFDPRRHLSVDRCLHRDRHGKTRWEEFKNMALAARARVQADEQARKDAEATP